MREIETDTDSENQSDTETCQYCCECSREDGDNSKHGSETLNNEQQQLTRRGQQSPSDWWLHIVDTERKVSSAQSARQQW